MVGHVRSCRLCESPGNHHEGCGGWQISRTSNDRENKRKVSSVRTVSVWYPKLLLKLEAVLIAMTLPLPHLTPPSDSCLEKQEVPGWFFSDTTYYMIPDIWSCHWSVIYSRRQRKSWHDSTDVSTVKNNKANFGVVRYTKLQRWIGIPSTQYVANHTDPTKLVTKTILAVYG